MSERYVLGSGDLYVVEAVEAQGGGYEIPADNEIETDANKLGEVQGGATLEYTPEFHEVKSDLGRVNDQFLTEEAVTLKSGILTWNTETLEKLATTGRVTEDGSKKTIKIGGLENYDNSKYIIRFVHLDSKMGDLRVTIAGSNTSGFELAFAKDQETVVNAEFSATPIEGDGTLVVIEETEPGSATYGYVAVTPVGTENPHEEGWFTRHGEEGEYEYWPTDDEEVEQDVTYYEYKEITTP